MIRSFTGKTNRNEEMNMQNISLVGRLTKEMELKTIPNPTGNTMIGKGTIAVKRKRYNKEKQTRDTTFIHFQVWGKRAETLQQYTTKGSQVELVGELINNNYTDKQNIKRYELLFDVSDFELLEKKEETEKRMQNEQQQNFSNSNQPMNTQPQQQSVHPSNPHEQPSIDGMNQYGANTNQ